MKLKFNNNVRRTLFLDRDGVINIKLDNDYVKKWDEFIFIDGGSTDNTYQIISSFDDERVSFRLSEKDDGVASALNKGFSQARGKYLTWMNADDEYFDNFS